jgi:hypothetical protein
MLLPQVQGTLLLLLPPPPQLLLLLLALLGAGKSVAAWAKN